MLTRMLKLKLCTEVAALGSCHHVETRCFITGGYSWRKPPVAAGHRGQFELEGSVMSPQHIRALNSVQFLIISLILMVMS